MDIIDIYKYNSVDVARYIIAKSNEKKLGINITKLQKLLYIAYGAFLVVSPNEGRLTNEHPQAWPYGPVFPTTRNKLLNEDLSTIETPKEKDDFLEQLISFVLKGFGTWSAGQLTIWSHENHSPWHRTTEIEGFKWGDQIPDEYIREYFSKIIIINGEKRKDK